MLSHPLRAIGTLVVFLVAASAPTGCGDGGRERVTVLAASSLTSVFADIETAFEAAHPDVDLVVSSGGSPSLAAQAADRAPASLLITADDRSMATAVDSGVVDGDPVPIATNHVVLARSRDATAVDSPQDFARSAPILVLCAPEVPCGASAVELLDALGVDADADSLESSVRAVVTRLRLGEADAGIVYRTDVEDADGAIEIIETGMPATVGSVRYLAAALTEAPGGATLLDFIAGDEGRRLLADHGFGPP